MRGTVGTNNLLNEVVSKSASIGVFYPSTVLALSLVNSIRKLFMVVRPTIDVNEILPRPDTLLVCYERGANVLLFIELLADQLLEEVQLAIESRLTFEWGNRLQILQCRPKTSCHLRLSGAHESKLIERESDVAVPP